MITLTKRKSFAKKFDIGMHIATVTKFCEAQPNVAPWKDVTKQFETTVTNDAGQQERIYSNADGFVNATDVKGILKAGESFQSSLNAKTGESNEENYLCKTVTDPKTKEKKLVRVKSKEKTDTAIRMFGELLIACGIVNDNDTFATLADIVKLAHERMEGAQVGITIEMKDDKRRVYYDDANEIEEKIASALEADA